MDLGPPELIIVLVIVLVLFGGRKLPDLARSLGQAKREFNEGSKKDDEAKSKDAPTKATASDEPIVEVPAPQVEADSSPSNPSGGSTTT
ncbi:MAG: twin-arginine translocase TatA/TatE family subunit [Acidimicrobiia bacterium]|nr:twin-arginine translocase TatA/TatE family subunit [Acidimicrobiia bacterium]